MVACDFVCRDGLCIFVVVKSFKDIVADWRREFPLLKPYTPSLIVKRCGPFLVGLRFDKYWNSEYRVCLQFLPLWLPFTDILNWPLLNIELREKDRKSEFLRPMDIRYELHDRVFDRAVEEARSQFGDVLGDRVAVEKLIRSVDENAAISFPEHRPAFWSHLCEFKVVLALYFDSPEMMENAKGWIADEVQFWDEDNVRALYSMTKGEWVDDLYARYADRDAFMARIAENMSRPRIALLNSAELVYDPAKIVPYRRGIWSRMRLWVALLRFRLRELRIKIYHRINL